MSTIDAEVDKGDALERAGVFSTAAGGGVLAKMTYKSYHSTVT